MDEKMIKRAAETITMPEDVKRRIIENGRISMAKEETAPKRMRKKPAKAIVALVICLMLTATALAATETLKGFFRDITDWRGSVIGTAYEQATEEIDLIASVSGETLTVRAMFVDPQEFPYRTSEQLGIAAGQIIDAAGNTVWEGPVDPVPVIDGQVEIPVPLSGIDSGTYTLRIVAFVSEKKADQPLEISGNWELSFEKP